MATFIVLASFTDQGIHEVKDTIGRAEAFKEMAKKIGVSVKDIYWTLGSYDVVAICEAPDDESASALALSVGQFRFGTGKATVMLQRRDHPPGLLDPRGVNLGNDKSRFVTAVGQYSPPRVHD